MSAAALPDGGCVIAYKYSGSPFTIKYAVLSKAGVLQTAVTVANGITQAYTIRIAVLSDGKICVIYYNSNTVGSGIISFAIYSTSYVLLNSGVLPGLSTTESPSTNGARIADLAALPDGYFVVAYAVDTSGLNFKTFTNTGAAYSANYSVSGATTTADQNLAVAGCLDGSVMVFWKNSTTTYSFQLYRKTAGSAVYTSAGSGSVGGTSVQQVERQVALCPDGGFFYNSINTTIRLNKTNMSVTAIGNTVDTSGSPTPSVASLGLAVTGSGLMLSYNPQVGILYYYTATTLPSPFTLSLANNGANSHTVMAGSYANNAFIGLVNASSFPTYTLVSMGAVTYPFVYTTSNFATPLTASPTTGYYLVGVATTDCAPGGTGTVQINGSVSLSGSYPSNTTYQAFDFSNPTLYGVRGTIVGRSITMQGNV
jgi:hypothetical protein